MTIHLVTALLVAAALASGCGRHSAAGRDPDLRPHGEEPTVAVTVATGPETMPTWQRAGGRSALAIPADLLFATDSADLGPAAVDVLARVLDEVDVGAQVLVEGHADGDGDPAHNQQLSEGRASAVGAWFADHGVAPSAITTRGWGETRPVAEEKDETDKSENRRVVITVTFSERAGRTR